MEDLAGKLNALLQDPKLMEQVQALAGAQGQPESTAPATQAEGLSSLASLLGQNGSSDFLRTLTRILPLLQQVQQEDDATRFLRSLRPMLRAPRQKRLDEAAKLLQLFRLLPLLRSEGIL